MGVREETVEMLKQGMSPSQIATSRGVTLTTILAYLNEMVGRGIIRRSDIFFAIPADHRNAILSELSTGKTSATWKIAERLKRKGIDVTKDDVTIIQEYGDSGQALGDIYEYIRTIEVRLHQLIRKCLENEFGLDDNGWWRQGVPQNIRGRCGERREMEDYDLTEHAYCYTDLIDLKEIINKNWNIFSNRFPRDSTKNKKQLMQDFERLNLIRRMVMHPVRGNIPSEDDFAFLRVIKSRLGFT